MIGSRPQGRGRGSSSISSSSSQPLPSINQQQSSDLTQYIELDSNIDPDDENFKSRAEQRQSFLLALSGNLRRIPPSPTILLRLPKSSSPSPSLPSKSSPEIICKLDISLSFAVSVLDFLTAVITEHPYKEMELSRVQRESLLPALSGNLRWIPPPSTILLRSPKSSSPSPSQPSHRDFSSL
ncbi:hypothetical protein TorRG33x02_182900 [Trema orientale]|uniref:Uncharacterized protein n=1 Tax=Trema orientale TaxID=63057 RepID=A0A2P5EK68_TREOI|nr:hypothetical protein TorRG33x02_182900 [Trema orientale]